MKAELNSWTKKFSQEEDTCSSSDGQFLTLEQDDGGGGPFWRIRTEEWSFDSVDELVELLESAGVERRKTSEAA